MFSLNKIYLFILVFIITLFILPAVLFAQDVIAYIGEIGGEVMVIKSNPGEELSAELGMLLGEGDTVKTGDESYTSIIFQDDGSRVKLGERSELTLNTTRQKKKLNKRLHLGVGKLWAKITKRKGTDFQISTPTSVASVKGTGFVVEERSNPGETNYWVTEECVLVANTLQESTVCEGQKAIVTDQFINVEEIEPGDIPAEPGKHILFFYLSDDSGAVQKQLFIEYEK